MPSPQEYWSDVYAIIVYREVGKPHSYKFKVCKDESELVQNRLILLFDDKFENVQVRGPKSQNEVSNVK